MNLKQTKPIRKSDIIRVFLRSFFLQSIWNYQSLLSVGFELCLFPIAKRLYPDDQPRKEFLQRHLKFFNAHPYLASYALGVSIRLEEGIASGSEERCHQLERVKDLLIPTLGAKGDQLFWLTIRPYSLIVGILGLFMLESNVLRLAVLILVFTIFNIPHFYIRFIGLTEGYEFGLDVYKCLTNDRFKSLEKIYFYVGVAAILVFIVLLTLKYYQEDPTKVAILVGSAFYSAILYKISNNLYSTIFFSILFFLLVGFLFF